MLKIIQIHPFSNRKQWRKKDMLGKIRLQLCNREPHFGEGWPRTGEK